MSRRDDPGPNGARSSGAEQLADNQSSQIADEIRRTGREPNADLAYKFNLTAGEAKLVEANQPLPELGSPAGLIANHFSTSPGRDLSAPIHTERGYVIVSVKDIQPAHPATLAEVHDQVTSDYRRECCGTGQEPAPVNLPSEPNQVRTLPRRPWRLGLEVKTSERDLADQLYT